MASVHRELAEKQSLAFSMTFLPTKLELTTASADGSLVFEFSSPDMRCSFEQAFEEAKKKLGEDAVAGTLDDFFPGSFRRGGGGGGAGLFFPSPLLCGWWGPLIV